MKDNTGKMLYEIYFKHISNIFKYFHAYLYIVLHFSNGLQSNMDLLE